MRRAGPDGPARGAVYPHRRHLAAKVRGFLDLLARRIGDHRRWMEPELAAGEGSAPATPR